MSAFDSNAFSTDAFSVNAFDFGAGPPPPPPPPAAPSIKPSGGFPAAEPRRTKADISRDRERFGIRDEVADAIAQVAAQQAARLEQDAQKRFEELNRELELRGLEWDARYLEELNIQRERLINAEIALRIRQAIMDDEALMLLVMMAAAAA